MPNEFSESGNAGPDSGSGFSTEDLQTPRLTFEAYQSATAAAAQYEQAKDPEMVLRSGLIEEVIEIIDSDTEDADVQHKSGEIGDVLWYLSEISRHKGVSLVEMASSG